MHTLHFSLRTTLLVITGVLSLIIAGLSAANLNASTAHLRELEGLKNASLISDQLFEATSRLTLEHDIGLSMLRAADAQTIAELRPRLIESRRGTDHAFRSMFTALKEYEFADLSGLRSSIMLQLANIESLRPGVDAALYLPLRRRPAALSEDWTREVSALVDATEALWVRFIERFVNVDPLATLHLRFKHQMRIIRGETELERSLIGQLIAENTHPDTQQYIDLLHAQGAAESSWQNSRTIAVHGRLAEAIGEQYSDARSHYETMRSMTQGMFTSIGGLGEADYPLGPGLWYELSLQAAESFDLLTEATVAATRAYLDRLIAEARGDIALQGLVLAVTALLCAASFWIVIHRVIRPVNSMVDALVRATRGEQVSLPAAGVNSDEIGQLSQVLQAFHEAMHEVRRTAAELGRSRSRLRAVVDHAVDGLVTLNSKGNILSFNPACERLFGYTAAEAIGAPITLLAPRLYADSAYGDLASLAPASGSRGGDTSAHESRGRRKNRTTFAMEIAVSSYQLENETLYAMFMRDVTRRRQAEQSLIEYTHALELSNQELDDFAYIASHDLREPLRGIHNHARFLLEDNVGKLNEESVGRLNRLVHLSQRMELLISDLLYFSRLGRQDLAVQTTDLAEVVRDVQSTLEHLLEERHASIVLQDNMPTAHCDKTRVTELLRNLITNAVKYNDRPEKLIEVGFVASRTRPSGETARKVYFVRDNGRGIDAEFHEAIFRIFKRLQAADSTETGTGAGLTFVKKIVERHGGQIWVESTLGEGATFYFTLEASHDDRKFGSKAA
jgi:PAS domain S-box-containing protein